MDVLKVYKDKRIGKVRVAIIDGLLYFVVKDIVHILYYSSVRDALGCLKDKEDVIIKVHKSINNKDGLVVVNEKGLKYLIDNSTMPKVKELRRWLYEEIMPSLYF